MEDVITPKEISKLIELRKLRAETEFKKQILSDAEEEAEKMKAEVESMISEINRLTDKLKRANVIFALPNESRIDEYNAEIDSAGHKEVHNALKSRTGHVYELLLKRGSMIKENFNNREDIAKLVLLANTLDEEQKNRFFDSLRSGVVTDSSMEGIDETRKGNLMRLMKRIGFVSSNDEHDEVLVDIGDRKVWISKEKEKDILANLENLRALNSKIQLKNAEKQVKVFSDEEEKEFAMIQQSYLELLKEKDGLLKEFENEEKEFSYKVLRT